MSDWSHGYRRSPMLPLYLLLPILAIAAETPWSCTQNTVRVNITSGPVSFPANGTTLTYKKNMNCSWTVWSYAPPGFYYAVKINANFTSMDSFSIRTSSGYQHDYMGTVRDIPQQFSDTLYFPSQELKITLISKSDSYFGALGFTLEMLPLPNTGNTYRIDLTRQDTVQQMQSFYYVNGIMSTKKYVIRLVASARDIKAAGCLIYTGLNPSEGAFVTGMDTQYDGIPQVFSKNVSVVCLSDTRSTAYLLAATLSGSIDPQSSWAVVIPSKNFSYDLASQNNKPSYLTTYCAYCVLRSVQEISNKAVPLQLYSGSLAPIDYGYDRFMQPLEDIPLSDADSYMPQVMCRDWNTYSITGGAVKLNISDYTTPQQTYDWQVIRPGRKWFVATDFYGYDTSPIKDVKIKSFFTTGDPLSFSFKMGNSDVLLDSANVVVTMNSDADAVADYTMVWSNNPKSYTAVGTGIHITTIPSSSIGTIVHFEATKTAFKSAILAVSTLLLCFYAY